ncbi:LAFA_0F00232g1_1 [Lachancea sp. 'fantastica']|nr:LAFA_0F00232g1_1 [Lachancea sp. 'fantastica']
MDVAFGSRLPSDLEHAVSVSMPKWDQTLAFEEKDPVYANKMLTGYPRYYLQPPTREVGQYLQRSLDEDFELFRPFASAQSAEKCVQYVKQRLGPDARVLKQVHTIGCTGKDHLQVAGIFASGDEAPLVQEYWKFSGEVMSTRFATFVLSQLQRKPDLEVPQFLAACRREEEMGASAKVALRERIVDRYSKRVSHKDVFFFASGMSTIFSTRKMILAWTALQSEDISTHSTVVIGFPFKDTPAVMDRFGPNHFYGLGDSRDIDQLENLLQRGETRVAAVFTETPSNPLLRFTDLGRIRRLADRYNFCFVIDDTIGGLNIDILGFADIVCTSLTKLFNGASNALAGSLVVNPSSKFHGFAVSYFSSSEIEDLLWCQDAVVLERNSRDFQARTLQTNANTEKLLKDVLLPELGTIFKNIHYPSLHPESKVNYDAVKTETGGYGCLLSLTFFEEESARRFYDSLNVCKGPSLGTNFTLAVPFVLLAHYEELDHVYDSYGVERNLVRVNVGLEDVEKLILIFRVAIDKARATDNSS